MGWRDVALWLVAVATASAIAFLMEPIMPAGDWKWALVVALGATLMWLLRRREPQSKTQSAPRHQGQASSERYRQARRQAWREAMPVFFWWIVVPLAIFVMIGWLLHELGV